VQRLEAGAGWTGVLLPALERWRLHRNNDHEVLRRDDGHDPAQPTATFKVSYNMLCKLRVGLWSRGDSSRESPERPEARSVDIRQEYPSCRVSPTS
jgi:hypothetical protein